MGIVKNKWQAELRKRARTENRNDSDQEASQTKSQDEQMVDREEQMHLQRILNNLGEPCKSLLYFFYFEERSLKDIVKLMGFANTDVVKSKKYQCKKALQSLLTKQSLKMQG